MDERRLDILQKIETGELSAQEGLRLISRLESKELTSQTEPGRASTEAENVPGAHTPETPARGEVVYSDAEPDFGRWRAWSWILFGMFTLLTAVSAVWMVQGWQAHPFGWGFWLAWIPFLIGAAGMALSISTRWLHIRIRHMSGEAPARVTISIPFPFGLLAWFSRTFPEWMPLSWRGVDLGAALEDLERGVSREQPFYIRVDGEDGEQVEIYIG